MKENKCDRVLFALTGFFLLMFSAKADAQVAIHADVNKAIVSLNEQITLTVSVTGSGGSIPDPQIPLLSNFSVYSSGKSQSISIINGQMETDTEYTYVLVPRFVGKGTIPPISISYGGRRYETHPIVIEVSPHGAASGGGGNSVQASPGVSVQSASGYNYARNRAPTSPDVFVKAIVDRKKVYVNEQTTLSVRFLTAVSLAGSPQYTPPKLSGFISEDLPPQRNGRTTVNGRDYYYSEIKLALFPVQAGKLEIGPATVNCRIEKSLAIDPFSQSFINNIFSGQLGMDQPETLHSEPLILTALPLPEKGKPANFSGAVGDFSISASVDRTRVNVGDAVNLKMVISGQGNLKSLESPSIPAMPDFHVYDTVSSINLDKKNDIVQGSKVFKTVLVPRISGTLTIPKISFSFFNPKTRSYQTIDSPSITLHVEKGASGSNAGNVSNFAASAAQDVSTISEDIRYLKPYQKTSLPERFLGAMSSAGIFNLFPFAFFAFFFGIDQYEEMKARNPLEVRKRQAFKKALQIVEKARTEHLSDPKEMTDQLSEALIGYLADKLGKSPSALTLKGLAQETQKANLPISANTLENLKRVWDEIDSRRFAPAGAASKTANSEIAEDISALIESIERELK